MGFYSAGRRYTVPATLAQAAIRYPESSADWTRGPARRLGADEYANEQALGAGMDIDDAFDLARTLANPESQGAVAES